MARVDREEVDELWDEFHAVVNMTSRELSDWLRTEGAGPDAEDLPDRAGDGTGQRVLRLLGKRKVDVDADDAQLMRQVVDLVRAERGEDPEPTAGDAAWRHRLMDVGHDPLKPTT